VINDTCICAVIKISADKGVKLSSLYARLNRRSTNHIWIYTFSSTMIVVASTRKRPRVSEAIDFSAYWINYDPATNFFIERKSTLKDSACFFLRKSKISFTSFSTFFFLFFTAEKLTRSTVPLEPLELLWFLIKCVN